MTLKEIAQDVLDENHITGMMRILDEIESRKVPTLDEDLVEERRKYEKCKSCGKFKSKGRPCSHCPEKNNFILSRIESIEEGIANNQWTEETKEKARNEISQLLSELHTPGKFGKGKGWHNRSVVLGELSEDGSDAMKNANPDINVSPGMEATIDTDQIVHALKEHGANAKHRQPFEVPLTENDILLVPNVLSDFVAVIPGLGRADGKKQDGVELWKKIGDGIYLCVVVDHFDTKENKAKVKFQTMLKFKRQTDESLA